MFDSSSPLMFGLFLCFGSLLHACKGRYVGCLEMDVMRPLSLMTYLLATGSLWGANFDSLKIAKINTDSDERQSGSEHFDRDSRILGQAIFFVCFTHLKSLIEALIGINWRFLMTHWDILGSNRTCAPYCSR